MIRADIADAPILVVDDEPSNVALLERLLERWGYRNVSSTTDSAQVVALCERLRPDLLLLDLHMPPPDGFELLDLLAPWVASQGYMPILVLTADTTREAKQRALLGGAKDFLHKPLDAAEVELRVRNLLETRRLHIALMSHNEQLEERVQVRTADLEQSRLEILDRLALAAEFRDDATQQHAHRIGRTAGLLAERLGLPEMTVGEISRAAPLHDVGKIGIPDQILLKPGNLTIGEFDTMKRHTTIGARMLSRSRARLLRVAEEIALSHHESWDGSGYPQGLAATEIPIAGRIVAVADVFDALTHRRPYKEAWPLAAAVQEIDELSERKFDPTVVVAFRALDHAALLEPPATNGDAPEPAALG